ncbi:MAG: hypothetical protein LHW64_11210 [Candidatus Cloacimonetes bacterium]|jgi:hypothetical protein|nr:hypothetical protein [Candidatus Cloacimonadota bacterium]MDY0230657.1 hypothetical protein [Candidatus Cloacimonadaceae bacterium]
MLLLALALSLPLLGILYALIALYEAFTRGHIKITTTSHLNLNISHPSEMQVTFNHPKETP